MSEKPRRRLTLQAVSIAYFVLLAITCIAMEWWAEYLLPVWFLLFAPPVVLLLPVPILALIALRLRRWRLLLAYAFCTFAVLFGFARFRLPSGGADGKAFTVITHNAGQGNRVSFDRSFPGESPDVVLLQDATHEKYYSRAFPAMNVKRLSKFVLLTPHEIEDGQLVRGALWRGAPVAARYVVRTAEKTVALYNVHLPTPRRSLAHAWHPRVAKEMLWIRDAPTDDYPSYRAWLKARVTLAEELANVMAQEKLPFIVAGDFNTPDHGVVYRTFANRLEDAHARAGRGWGFTFPGGQGRVLSKVGPWLRLDYVFASPSWRPVDCRVAPDLKSQHRPVLARFVPNS